MACKSSARSVAGAPSPRASQGSDRLEVAQALRHDEQGTARLELLGEQLHQIPTGSDDAVLLPVAPDGAHGEDLLGELHVLHQRLRDAAFGQKLDRPLLQRSVVERARDMEEVAVSERHVVQRGRPLHQAAGAAVGVGVGDEPAALGAALQDDLDAQVGSHALTHEDRARQQIAENGRRGPGRLLRRDGGQDGLRGPRGDDAEGAVISQRADDAVGFWDRLAQRVVSRGTVGPLQCTRRRVGCLASNGAAAARLPYPAAWRASLASPSSIVTRGA